MQGMERRTFFGRLLDGFLAAVGLRRVAKAPEGWGDAGAGIGPDGIYLDGAPQVNMTLPIPAGLDQYVVTATPDRGPRTVYVAKFPPGCHHLRGPRA